MSPAPEEEPVRLPFPFEPSLLLACEDFDYACLVVDQTLTRRGRARQTARTDPSASGTGPAESPPTLVGALLRVVDNRPD